MIHTYTDSHIQEDQKDTSELHKRKPKITEYSTKEGWVHRTPDGIQILAKTILPTAYMWPLIYSGQNQPQNRVDRSDTAYMLLDTFQYFQEKDSWQISTYDQGGGKWYTRLPLVSLYC